MTKLVTGGTDWNEGRKSGEVQVEGNEDAWDRMLIATAQPGAKPRVLDPDSD